MSAVQQPQTRHERQAALAAQETVGRRMHRARAAAFGLIVTVVLVGGAYLAFGDFLGQRGASSGSVISVQSSMAGFGPKEIHVKAGQLVTLDWWTQDAAVHLDGGVHTLISHELGLHEELPAAGPSGESRKPVTFTAPLKTGEYDIVCETCCGGAANPAMHGKIVVEV